MNVNNKTKIVVVNHISYKNKIFTAKYYFKTTDDVKIGDIVLCDTSNGAALGVVVEVISIITIDDLLKSDFYEYLTSGRFYKLKDCKLLPDYKKIKLEKEDLPF